MPDAATLLPWAVGALTAVVAFIGRAALAKLSRIEDKLNTELRAMDVRLTRIEEHLWPDRWIDR